MGHLCCPLADIICELAGYNFIEESSSESDDNDAVSVEDCQEDEDNDCTDE